MSYLVSIFVLGLLIAFHELGHYAAARLLGMRVLRYSIGFFKPLVSWTSRKTGIAYQLGALPLGGFVQIKGMNPFEDGAFEDADSYQTKPAWRRFAVIAAGPVANFALAFVALAVLFSVGNPVEVDEARVGLVAEGGPAARAGLATDDRVLRIDGAPVATWSELAAKLHASPGRRLELLVERGGARRTVAVTPEERNGVGLIGIGQPTTTVRLPVHEALAASFSKCVGAVGGTVVAFAGWIGGSDTSMTPIGPVGIVKIAATSLEVGLARFVAFATYLSLMLFLFNLFPFPALDGGRLIVLLGEAVARRRINRKVDAYVNTAGFFLVLGLVAVITFKELVFG